MGRIGTADDPARMGATVHQIVVGAAFDGGTTTFTQAEQTATFVGDREAVGTGPFATETDVDTRVSYAGIYLADSISLTPQWTLVLSGRYNTARITTTDLTGEAPAIDGTNTYRRFNPAIGATWEANAAINAFGNISQGMRVPTPVELTCADPNAPCTLPNIFVADPPLQPVIATTSRPACAAASLPRGTIVRRFTGRTFATTSSSSARAAAPSMPDIFRTSAIRAAQGIELAGGAASGEFSLVARYTFLDATFETAFAESSPNDSTADAEGLGQVQPGNPLPGLPRNAFRGCAAIGRGDHSPPASRCSRSVPNTRAATKTTATSTGRCLGTPWSR